MPLPLMDISLKRKKILVTGASGAVGRAVAEQALDSGAWVAGSYLQSEEDARALERRGVFMVKADLTSRSQARDMVRAVLAEGGHLDGVVYSAGNTRDRTAAKITDQEWDEVIAVHLNSLFAVTQEVLPVMRERKAGKLVAIGSLSGVIGRFGQPNYSAAKAGVVGYMKSVAKEAGRFGVTANVVCPGFVDSRMTRKIPQEAWERAKNESALGTISSVETASSFIVWLLSDLCKNVTGQVFQLDSRI